MLALDRVSHHPISRKDIIPTPSQPIKSWYMLLAVMMIIIVIKKVIKYLMNLLILGSEDIYQMENSVMDQVINRATGIKVNDSVSSVMVMLIFSVGVAIRGSSVIVSS